MIILCTNPFAIVDYVWLLCKVLLKGTIAFKSYDNYFDIMCQFFGNHMTNQCLIYYVSFKTTPK